ncbi:DUF397 domain-containing protein [Streptomonospora nanhaiensis]|uniref:DUF397 domain-containing protein n=1 Tax=Streptomonospora nanhaiensis TaxID=1323731 RepID=A0A853BS83_9ACTN|nr:DUF397 domain-containing protein [Streptomonospora nanhaiensis]MBV2366356.1 DUF397 domain-containing protein [Streptomonospora nanhaiensis]MBX9391983.1 DUF397 domain-containing protein [Streptomonospora nanhaiensis]NYI97407.1 hypothetical protein [Streptomonospora nanhaiensis]
MVDQWHKSTYSAAAQNCVEVREHAAGADVRDTQNRDAGHLSMPAAEWAAFLVAVKTADL